MVSLTYASRELLFLRTYTTNECRSAIDTSPYRHLLRYRECDETNTRHLLMSLPSSLNSIVDNLQPKMDLTYIDTRSW